MKFNDMKQHDANDWKSRLGMVYSTDPDFRYTTDEVEEPETLPPDKQTLRVWLDRKQRAGRVVTLVRGFRGTAADLEALGRMLKQRCGVGGSVKEGEIIVQGDHRDRIVEILLRAVCVMRTNRISVAGGCGWCDPADRTDFSRSGAVRAGRLVCDPCHPPAFLQP